MKVKMLAIDLDKTLLHNDEKLSQASIEVIKRYQDKGILLVIATSRSLSSTRKYAEILAPDAIISSGGAEAFVGEHEVYKALFSEEKSAEYIEKCLREPTVDYIRVVGEKVDFTNNPAIPVGEKEYGHYHRTTFEEKIRQKVSKITIYSSDRKCIEAMFQGEEECYLSPSYAGESCHKLSHARATKEDALLYVAKHLGVRVDEIIACGDDLPDIGMLSMCGIGVAVENALSEVKAVADVVCDSNEADGVAKYLQEHYEAWLE
ncbi:MAG: HAD family phosphatase [Lachnospiraceae bacterium]|nr:HAD family phosphatase [Lachnospiraceae bacterium]